MALDRSKRLPPLKSLLPGNPEKQRPKQTWQDHARIARQLNAAFGGTLTKASQPNA